jgi:creatinine amidohydrolase
MEGLEARVMQLEWRKKHFLMDMTSAAAKKWLEKTDMVILPAGSCEQHGSHLPLGTDAYQALMLACAIAEKTDLPIAPLIWPGLSPYHMPMPGTITLRYETYVNFVYDVCRSLIHHGFNKIIVSLNHKGNAGAMAHAARKVRYDTGAMVVLLKGDGIVSKASRGLFEIPADEKDQKVRHGGETETSRILYWNPGLVHLELGQPHKMETPRGYPQSLKALSHEFVGFAEAGFEVALDFDEVASSGSLGDPRQASPEKGQILVETVAEYYIRAVEEIRKIPVKVKQREFQERL